jgi:hypothetical protein
MIYERELGSDFNGPAIVQHLRYSHSASLPTGWLRRLSRPLLGLGWVWLKKGISASRP